MLLPTVTFEYDLKRDGKLLVIFRSEMEAEVHAHDQHVDWTRAAMSSADRFCANVRMSIGAAWEMGMMQVR